MSRRSLTILPLRRVIDLFLLPGIGSEQATERPAQLHRRTLIPKRGSLRPHGELGVGFEFVNHLNCWLSEGPDDLTLSKDILLLEEDRIRARVLVRARYVVAASPVLSETHAHHPVFVDGVAKGVEVWAHDDVAYSNTYFLEHVRGWSGPCIEANPDVLDQLRQSRHCAIVGCVIGEREGIAQFTVLTGYS